MTVASTGAIDASSVPARAAFDHFSDAVQGSPWTSETSGSSGRSATGFAIRVEKRVPAALATSLADCEVDSVSVQDRPKPAGFAFFCGFFLFKQIPSSASSERQERRMRQDGNLDPSGRRQPTVQKMMKVFSREDFSPSSKNQYVT
jgi:hypothetical protein